MFIVVVSVMSVIVIFQNYRCDVPVGSCWQYVKNNRNNNDNKYNNDNDGDKRDALENYA